MRRFLLAVVVALLLPCAAFSQTTTTAAPTTTTTVTTTTTSTTTTTTLPPAGWKVLQNSNCTGLRAGTVSGQATSAAACCVTSKNGFCNRRENFGHLFEVMVTLVGTGTYTSGGDLLAAAEWGKIGLDQLVYADCNLGRGSSETPVYFPLFLRTATFHSPLIKLFTATGTQASGSMAGVVLECLLFGY